MIPPIRKRDPERGIVRVLLDVQPICQRPCLMGSCMPDKPTGGSRMRRAAATVDNAAGPSLALELR